MVLFFIRYSKLKKSLERVVSRQYPILILKKIFSRKGCRGIRIHPHQQHSYHTHLPLPAAPTQLANAAINSTSADNTINNPIGNTTIVTLLLLDRLIIQQTYTILARGAISRWRADGGRAPNLPQQQVYAKRSRTSARIRTREALPKLL